MGIIIDTCIFIHQERNLGNSALHQLETDEQIYIAAITVSELLMGVHCANVEEKKLKRSALVEAAISKIPVLSFNEEIARIHAEVHAYLFKKGNIIGAHDLIIAATALFYDYSLMTTNLKEFGQVPGLKIFKSN